MAYKPSLRIVDTSPWNDPRSYRPDPVETLRQRLLEEDRKRIRLQRAVAWWCIIIAYAAVGYFGAQLARGAL